ncbi:Holliday junction branch migration protein RuvA [Clostridium sp. D2Q-14]|uniref:Holliday junction branch migration protein RuvA n=1 Tax=Anaeromonas gelatinilytica TaxID=2683194 RepID=UPI00193C15ED|nr:Holliday junction branch migration protein RuvA [Anaeromonas gelatinilytica]MBS4534247.1 Holliday junction branch migration protein RuvA [Anaeromonas gelatinilytica]
MYRYIKGYINEISEDFIVVDNNNIGYKISTSMETISNVRINEEYKIYTHLHVREDDMSLYGFISRSELELFLKLISVSKIGPKVALGILSSLSVDKIKFAIINEDTKTLSKAPGVGKKTANRMILELKDRIKDYNIEKLDSSSMVNNKSNINEALDALIALGYTKYEASNVMNKFDIEKLNTEDIIKLSLSELSKQ